MINHTEIIELELHRKAGELAALKFNTKKSLLKRLDAIVTEITEDAAAFGVFDSDENEYRQYRVLMAQLEAVAITLADESFTAILD